MLHKSVLLGITVLILCGGARTAWGQEDHEDPHSTFTLYWENDAFTGTDRNYTNGFKLTWGKAYTKQREANGGLTKWMIDHLPFINDPQAQRGTSFSIGQNIYTPVDTQTTERIEDDRPYAGFSYIGYGFVSQKGRRRDVWEIDIGVVGPLSQAQAVQDFVHDTLDFDRANGWDNQLDNEVALEAICESKWRLWRTPQRHGVEFDLIPHLGGRIGNVAIYANTGLEARFGWYVPKDFGSCPIRPGCDVGDSNTGVTGHNSRNTFGLHWFASVDGRFVLRDIFLDGNTFQGSHGVDKEPFVADLMAGIAMRFGALNISYAYILRTRELEEQEKSHNFGAFNLTYTF
ncbi:MAG: lipid A deacylase LpxR family protein [Desulfobacteraceae bacterium]|jgi:hypothetical protein